MEAHQENQHTLKSHILSKQQQVDPIKRLWQVRERDIFSRGLFKSATVFFAKSLKTKSILNTSSSFLTIAGWLTDVELLLRRKVLSGIV